MYMVIDNGVKLSKEAVLSISGGLDSTSLLIHLLDKDYDVYGILKRNSIAEKQQKI